MDDTPENLIHSISDLQLVAAAPICTVRAVIGISSASKDSNSLSAIMAMVRALGGVPVFLGNHKERIKNGAAAGVDEIIRKIDGVLIMGNNLDIDPAKYGAECHPETKRETDCARADFEEALIRGAIEHRMPLVGICGGMQRINVTCGGTLHQHLPSVVGHHEHAQDRQGLPGFVPVQYIQLMGETLMAQINPDIMRGDHGYDAGIIHENSFHHQSIHELADGFRVNATSDDGIVKGIEAIPGKRFGQQFIMGMQWHPEFAASHAGSSVVQCLIMQAGQFAKSSERCHHPAEAMVENMRSTLCDTLLHCPKN